MSWQLEGTGSSRELPKMPPLETAQVRLAAVRNVSLQVVEGLRKVAFLPLTLRLAHVARISVRSSDPSKARHGDRRGRRSGGCKQQQRQGCGERGLASAPLPESIRRAGRPRQDGLVAKETAEF